MGNRASCDAGSDSGSDSGDDNALSQLKADRGSVCEQAPEGEPESLVQYVGPGPWWVCAPNAEVPPRLAASGYASANGIPPMTMMGLLTKAAELKGDCEALKVERPLPEVVDKKVPPPLPRDDWTTWTYQEYLDEVRRAAGGMIALGLQPFESVNIWGFNAPEWHMSSLASMFAGAKGAGLYPTDTPDAAAFKVVHSCGAIVVAEDRKKIEKLAKALGDRRDCRRLNAFVGYGFEPAPQETIAVQGLPPVPILSWQALLSLGAADVGLERRISAVRPGHCASLIYTSGTTGDPKAVMISHDNLVYEGGAVSGVMNASCGFGDDGEERMLSYLPLSHIAGMCVDIIAPLSCAALYEGYGCIFFARPYDLKEKAIKDRLSVARPTAFLGVPLVWEKIADQIRTIGAQASGLKRHVAGVAKGVALDYAVRSQLGGDGSVPWGYSLANSVVLSKVKGTLGLDKCRFACTGAAPIRRDTLEFFGSLGLQINELYGMSECTSAVTVSTDQAHLWGSCGWALPGCEVKVFQVDPTNINKKVERPRAPDIDDLDERYQGELCFRGRNIMMGYMACPDFGPAHQAEIAKKCAESIDSEGWLHSGDKALITEQGMTKITGRFKEIIIGEGGENIAPVPVEDAVKKACDGIAEVIMIGDKRKYNVALVTLKAVGANGESPGTDQLDAGARRVNPAVKTISAAIHDKAWIDAVTAAITAANNDGKCCPNNAFKIQKFTILPTNFSEEGGELTPTKKLKRKVVETTYHAIIERLYAEEGVYIKCTA